MAVTAYIVGLRGRVAMHAPECPQPIIDDALERATRDLCRRSRVWRHRPAAFTVNGAVATNGIIDISGGLLSNTELVQVHRAKVDAQYVLTTKTQAQLDVLDPEWETREGQDPVYLTHLTQDTVRVVPHPKAAAADTFSLALEISLKPAVGAGELDSEVYSEYYEYLVSGALALLLTMPRKAWTSPSEAMMHAGVFESGVQRAKLQAENQRSDVVRTTSYGGI